jgi:hypothetical protein
VGADAEIGVALEGDAVEVADRVLELFREIAAVIRRGIVARRSRKTRQHRRHRESANTGFKQ